MNCYDCANAVASLANALGCRAEVVSILVDRPGQISPNFSTRPVSLIGEPANHLAVRKFPVHAVACVGGPTRHGESVRCMCEPRRKPRRGRGIAVLG